MKGIVLSFFIFFIFLVLLAVTNKIKSVRRARSSWLPIVLFVALVPVYWFIYVTTPMSLYIFPSPIWSDNLAIDVFSGLLIYAGLCVAFVDFLIASAISPFSTEILVIIHRSGLTGLSKNELQTQYCSGEGYEDIVGKRIRFLLRIGFITTSKDLYVVTRKARVVAIISQGLRRLSG